MARPSTITPDSLVPLLRQRGPVSATELAEALRVNRTTVVRTLAGLGEALVTMGATRSTRYALRRQIGNAGSHWPVYRIDEAGKAHPWGEIEALHEQQWRMTWAAEPPAWARKCSDGEGVWNGFPFFLRDLRPGGFLGRFIARHAAPTLSVPADPRAWSDDHTLLYLQAFGENLPGSLVVGDDCLRRALQAAVHPTEAATVPESSRAVRYPALAETPAASAPVSSVGGEQPKFLTSLLDPAGNTRAVIVKYSPPMDQATGRRWADLLLCEFHALEVLEAQGLALPGAKLYDFGNRRFLEIPRFDRCPRGGRRAVVSLAALHAATGGTGDHDWPAAVRTLHRTGWLDEDAASTTLRLHAFGELIGNTEMHHDNLSLCMADALPWRIAPAYDMLPMLWAPQHHGEITPRPFAPAPPIPATLPLWLQAAEWAAAFWNRLSADPRLSQDFSPIARQSHATLQRLRSHLT